MHRHGDRPQLHHLTSPCYSSFIYTMRIMIRMYFYSNHYIVLYT